MIAVAVAALVAAPPGLTLVGLVLHGREEARVAVVQSGARSRVGGVGDTVFGLRVAGIDETGVVLEGEDGRFLLRLSGESPRVTSAVAAPAAARAAAAPGEVEMERAEVMRRLGSESSRILAETTLVPMTQGGQVAGYTLTRVPEHSLLTDAGLQAGDVLVDVNGTPIDSLATLVGLYGRLQGESVLSATVLRQGRPLTLTVSLR